MPTLSTFIQHSTGSFSHSNWARKRNKGLQIKKEEVKFSLFVGDMALYIENPKDSTKKSCRIRNQCIKIHCISIH